MSTVPGTILLIYNPRMQFSHKGNLKIHQTKHSGDKPHKCSEVAMQFRWEMSLKRHKMIHTGIKPHRCKDCGKQFAGGVDLRGCVHIGFNIWINICNI